MALEFFGVIYSSYRTSLLDTEYRSRYYPQNSAGELASNSGAGTQQAMISCLEAIDKPPGYEDVTFEPRTLIPPEDAELKPTATRQNIKSFASITEEDVREAVILYAREHCCYGLNAGRDMKIKDIAMLSTFHYSLETFTEKRRMVWCCEPYRGEALKTQKNGIAPGPWDITQTPTEQFKDGTWQTEIPHTASAVSCYVCAGSGKEKCAMCNGSAQVQCTWCSGHGSRLNGELCTHCNGDGLKQCTECTYTGQMQCTTCAGSGKLKCYVKLITTWTNHKNDYTCQQTPLPHELISDITGHVAFYDQQPRVFPVDHFPQHSVNEASNNLVRKHWQEFANERILQQRHQVEIVPVAQVNYTWKDNFGEFFVYGFENKVYFPDYPQRCCGDCVIN